MNFKTTPFTFISCGDVTGQQCISFSTVDAILCSLLLDMQKLPGHAVTHTNAIGIAREFFRECGETANANARKKK